MCVCVVSRIDPLCFLARCRRRRLNQGLVVALVFFSLLDRACFCVIFSFYGCMLCLVRYLFIISTSVIDCLLRFVPEMTYYVSSGTLNLTKLKLKLSYVCMSVSLFVSHVPYVSLFMLLFIALLVIFPVFYSLLHIRMLHAFFSISGSFQLMFMYLQVAWWRCW